MRQHAFPSEYVYKDTNMLSADQCLLRKMRVLVAILLLACCSSSLSLGVYNRENSRRLTNVRNDAQFFQEMGNWFENLKNQFYKRWMGSTVTTPPPTPPEVLDLDKFQLQKRLKNREWLQVDLSSLSFDPDQDWGFRIGNWYFIHKRNKGRNAFDKDDSNESDVQVQSTVQPTDSINVEIQENDPKTDPETTEFSLVSTTVAATMHNVVQSVTQETNTQTTETSGDADLPENFSTENTQADNSFPREVSAEVLMG